MKRLTPDNCFAILFFKQNIAKISLLILFSFFIDSQLYTQSTQRYMDRLAESIHPTKKIIYKNVNNVELKLHIIESEDRDMNSFRPCVIGIHGGGWTGGNPSKVYPILQEFVKKGWVGISIEYRLMDGSKNTTVFDCVKDVKSAIHFVMEHAIELGIDSERITLCGLSAGGHLAIGSLLFESFNEVTDNMDIAINPQHLILYYPVLDTSSEGYGNLKIGDKWRELSPLHNIKKNMPSVIIFHSIKDDVVPIEGIINFQKQMVGYGNSCDLIIHGSGKHGYFIYEKRLYDEVINQTFSFLERESVLHSSN